LVLEMQVLRGLLFQEAEMVGLALLVEQARHAPQGRLEIRAMLGR
jgi:hypothetical protein